MPSRELKDAHPSLQAQFTKAKPDFEKKYPRIRVFLIATYRSREEQDSLYAQGRTEAGCIVTNTKAGQSAYNYNPSFAIDVAFLVDGKEDWTDKWFELFAPYMRNPEIDWGGN